MSQVVELVGDGACVRIVVLHYERPAATGHDDANWLVCELSLTSPAFRANSQATLRTFELAEFERSLRAALTAKDGEARFESVEEWLELNVAVGNVGGARVRATLRTHAPDAELSITFECDPVALCRALDQLAAALASFPVRR